jgi:transposase
MIGRVYGSPSDRMLCAIVAIVAVARKLAGIPHRMWIDGSDFKVGFGAKVTQRLKPKSA